MAVDYVCAVWLGAEKRWACVAVSRNQHRVNVCCLAAIWSGGHARTFIVPADDVDAAEARALTEPPPFETLVDVIASAIHDGRMVRIELPSEEVN